jgi:hypothetical protein
MEFPAWENPGNNVAHDAKNLPHDYIPCPNHDHCDVCEIMLETPEVMNIVLNTLRDARGLNELKLGCCEQLECAANDIRFIQLMAEIGAAPVEVTDEDIMLGRNENSKRRFIFYQCKWKSRHPWVMQFRKQFIPEVVVDEAAIGPVVPARTRWCFPFCLLHRVRQLFPSDTYTGYIPPA